MLSYAHVGGRSCTAVVWLTRNDILLVVSGRNIHEEAVSEPTSQSSFANGSSPVILAIIFCLGATVVLVAIIVHRRRAHGHAKVSDSLHMRNFVTVVKGENRATVVHGLDEVPLSPVNMDWDDLGTEVDGTPCSSVQSETVSESTLRQIATDATNYLESLTFVVEDEPESPWPSPMNAPCIEERESPEIESSLPDPQATPSIIADMIGVTTGSVPRPLSPPSPPHATIDFKKTAALQAALRVHKLDRLTLFPNRSELAALVKAHTDEDVQVEHEDCEDEIVTPRKRSYSISVSPRTPKLTHETDSKRFTLQRTVSSIQLLPPVTVKAVSMSPEPTDMSDEENSDEHIGEASEPLPMVQSPVSPRRTPPRKLSRTSWWRVSLLSDVTEERSICSDFQRLDDISIADVDERSWSLRSRKETLLRLAPKHVEPRPLNRDTAIRILLLTSEGRNGHFLVRSCEQSSDNEPDMYLSYTYENDVRHVPILQKQGLILLGLRPFESVIQAIEFFRSTAPEADVLMCKLTTLCQWSNNDLEGTNILGQSDSRRLDEIACEYLLDQIDNSRNANFALQQDHDSRECEI